MGILIDPSSMASASNALNVVSNNITNSTTVGYKQNNFQDILGTTSGGGKNNRLAGEVQDFTQGQIATATNSLDMAINGNGFFSVQNAQGELAFTRDGQFSTNTTGQVIDSGGNQLLGYKAINGAISPSSALVPLNIATQQPTTVLAASLVLDSTTIPSGTSTAASVTNGDPTNQNALASVFPLGTSAAVGATTASGVTVTALNYSYATTATLYDSTGASQEVNLYVVANGGVPTTGSATGTPSTNWSVYAVPKGGVPTLGSPTATIVANPATGALIAYKGTTAVVNDTLAATTVASANTANTTATAQVTTASTDATAATTAAATEASTPSSVNAAAAASSMVTLVSDANNLTTLVGNEITSLNNAATALNNAGDTTDGAKLATEVTNLTSELQTMSNSLSSPTAASLSTSVNAIKTELGTVSTDLSATTVSAVTALGTATVVPASGVALSGINSGVGVAQPNLTFSALTAGSGYSSNLTADGGPVTSTSVSSQGVISATYGGGKPIVMGQVMLSTFTNPGGLAPVGVNGKGNQWTQTADSGTPTVITPGTGVGGSILGSSTESSNVDLTTQLIDLIAAQRDYQAASQVIKVDGEVLQTAVSLVQ